MKRIGFHKEFSFGLCHPKIRNNAVLTVYSGRQTLIPRLKAIKNNHIGTLNTFACKMSLNRQGKCGFGNTLTP